MEGFPLSEPWLSIFLTTAMDSPPSTLPKTTCLPSSLPEKEERGEKGVLKQTASLRGAIVAYQLVFAVQRKNWDPFVLGPALAMDRIPGPVCFSVKFSSLNFSP